MHDAMGELLRGGEHLERIAVSLHGDDAALGLPELGLSGDVPDAFHVRDLMWRNAGLVRSRETLEHAVACLEAWRSAVARRRAEAPADRELRRLASLTTVGALIARAALRREESRGGHFRADFPGTDDARFLGHTVLDRSGPRLAPVDHPLENTAR